MQPRCWGSINPSRNSMRTQKKVPGCSEVLPTPLHTVQFFGAHLREVPTPWSIASRPARSPPSCLQPHTPRGGTARGGVPRETSLPSALFSFLLPLSRLLPGLATGFQHRLRSGRRSCWQSKQLWLMADLGDLWFRVGFSHKSSWNSDLFLLMGNQITRLIALGKPHVAAFCLAA